MSILEYGTPVCNSALRQEYIDIEHVQKVFLHIVLGKNKKNYENASTKNELNSLAERRVIPRKNFPAKSQKEPIKTVKTRHNTQKLRVPYTTVTIKL